MRWESGPPDDMQLEPRRHHDRLAAVVANAEEIGMFPDEISSEEVGIEGESQTVDIHVGYKLIGSQRRVHVHTREVPPADWQSEACLNLRSEAGYSDIEYEDLEPIITRFAREVKVNGTLDMQVPDGATMTVFLARENVFAVVSSNGRTATVLGPQATLNRCRIEWQVPTFD